MAQIDPNIALGFRMPQIQDPVAATARAQEIGVNALKMQELQRGLQEEQDIRNYLAGADLAKPETRAGLAKFGKTGLGYSKLLAEQEKTGLETKKLRGDIDKQALEQSRERISNIAFNPSNENIIAHLQDSILRGEMDERQAQGLWTQVKDLNPQQRKETFLQLGASAAKRLEQMTVSEAQKQQMDLTRRGQDITLQGQRMQYDPELQGRIAQAKEFGSQLGKNQQAAQAALPTAIETANEGIRLIDEMVGKREIKDASGKVIQKGTKPHPGFSSYVGATLVPGMRFVEGSDTASFDVRQKQIEGRAFLEAFNALKGGGSITEKEGEKGTAAIMRMNKASSEKEYVAAARELQDILGKGVERARAKAGGATAVPSAAPTAPAASGVIDFNSLK